MTKLILCSFAFALVPSITFSPSNNDKLDDKLDGKLGDKLIQRGVKVHSEPVTYSKSQDRSTQEDHSTSFKTGIQVRRKTVRNFILLIYLNLAACLAHY